MCLIQTKRTTIRKISLDDAKFIFELMNTPSWLQYIGDRKIYNIEAAEEYLKNGLIKYYEHPGYSYYLVQTKNEKPIGICGFLQRPNLENKDFGFAFKEEYHGQGYGYEVGREIMEYGISHFRFKVIDAFTHIDNVPSIALLKKLGFKGQGIIEYPENEKSSLFRWRSDQ